MTTYFDVETGPAQDDVLELLKPEFKAPSNYKDPIKIKCAVEESETIWRERAALDAKTAVVLSIGLLDDEPHVFTGPEPAIIGAFWERWNDGQRMVGFCCKNFDMPLLVQRSWILGIPVPPDLMEGRYWNRRIVDLQEVWCCFSNRTDGQSLDTICKASGMGGKSGSGANFAKLFATDRKAALDYLGRDLELIAALAKRLGIS